jgi:hypothetical protein
MPTTPRNIRFDDDLYARMMALKTYPLSAAYHIQEACRQYLERRTEPAGKVISTPAVSKPKAAIVIPDVINKQAWSEWVEYRKSKNKTVSKAAATKQFKMLANHPLDVQQQIIDQSIQNDYQGLFEPKGNTNGTANRFNGTSRPDKLTPAQEVRARREAAQSRQQSDVGFLGGDVKDVPSRMDGDRGQGADRDMGETILITDTRTD